MSGSAGGAGAVGGGIGATGPNAAGGEYSGGGMYAQPPQIGGPGGLGGMGGASPPPGMLPTGLPLMGQQPPMGQPQPMPQSGGMLGGQWQRPAQGMQSQTMPQLAPGSMSVGQPPMQAAAPPSAFGNLRPPQQQMRRPIRGQRMIYRGGQR